MYEWQPNLFYSALTPLNTLQLMWIRNCVFVDPNSTIFFLDEDVASLNNNILIAAYDMLRIKTLYASPSKIVKTNETPGPNTPLHVVHGFCIAGFIEK